VTAHVSLTAARVPAESNYEEMAAQLSAINGIRDLLRCGLPDSAAVVRGAARGVVTKGIDPERERKSDEALQHVVAGRLDFSADADGIDALLVGRQLADEWKALARGVCDADESAGKIDSVWIDTAHEAISRGRAYLIPALRLRRIGAS